MKLLHVDSSIAGGNSISRALTASIVARLTSLDQTITVSERDLATHPLPHVDLTSLPGGASSAAIASAAVLNEFLGADIVVIGAPMYNFSVPSQLKAWIDRILVAGKTFSYGEAGPAGLCAGKRVVIAIARGGKYGVDSPAAGFEHVETYLTGVFGFIGIKPEIILAEGVMMGPDVRAAVLAEADNAITALAA